MICCDRSGQRRGTGIALAKTKHEGFSRTGIVPFDSNRRAIYLVFRTALLPGPADLSSEQRVAQHECASSLHAPAAQALTKPITPHGRKIATSAARDAHVQAS